jgi:hypothetical protein
MKTPFTILALILLFQFSYAQQTLDSGLIAKYPFTGNALDSSGHGFNGTVYGPTLTAGKAGIPNTAYHFNGISDYIQVPDAPGLTPDTAITMCAVVRPMGFYSGNCQGNIILMKGPYEMTSGLYNMGFTDNGYDGNDCGSHDTTQETFYAQLSTNLPSAVAMYYPQPIVSGTWYCLIGTWDGSTFKMYVDGILKWSQPASTPIGINNAPLTIGHNIHIPFPYWFNGDIDDIRIYGRVLGSEQLKEYCDNVTGIKALHEIENSFAVFPNPSSGDINIKLNKEWNIVNAQLKVVDAVGKVVYQKIVSSQQSIFNFQLSPGIYLVQLQLKEGVVTKKIVVQ